MGPLGPYGADLAPSPPGQLLRSSQGRFFPPENDFLAFLVQNMVKQKVEIEGVRPIWRDPRRNSASAGLSGLQNGWMAT